ncbi:MAG: hypothetical protein ACTHQQ_02910, partial [Solirubrobacteraceae bacterium]
MRTVFVAAYLLGSVPSLVAQGVTLDPLRLVREDRIPEGPYRGGFLVAPNGKLNWYFANLGLRAFIRDMPTDVRTYLDLYIAHLRPDATIQDVIFAGSDWDHPQLLDSDSDDSYAASFLSLAIAYTRQTG